MGATVMVLWTASLIVAVVVAVQKDTDPVVRSAARLGFVISLAGMALGFIMTSPTAAQEEALESKTATMIGAHSVGVADGGPSMPVTGWATTGGDLRIPHFAGIHALQVLPLLALLLAVVAAKYPIRTRRNVVRVTAAAYAGLVTLLTWQALRGQPLLQPDLKTLAALGGLAVLTCAGVALAMKKRYPEGKPRPTALTDAGVAPAMQQR
ncbi:hypothetical protein ACQP00_14445 [Dactylosporangium sp. CS-047395]|uniref:hypothetical protein n=1 Tax=Dactylosporangium sp. CS-047395 TaxID=3239936 RepID=UPI003D94E1F8